MMNIFKMNIFNIRTYAFPLTAKALELFERQNLFFYVPLSCGFFKNKNKSRKSSFLRIVGGICITSCLSFKIPWTRVRKLTTCEQGSKFWQKIDCESEAKANFFSKKIAKRTSNYFLRSEFASLSQFFAKMRKFRPQFELWRDFLGQFFECH